MKFATFFLFGVIAFALTDGNSILRIDGKVYAEETGYKLYADYKVPKEPKEPKQPKEPKEPKEPKQPKEPKEPKEPKQPKEPKEPKIPRCPDFDGDGRPDC